MTAMIEAPSVWGALASLDNGELAVALNASDMPDRRTPEADAAQFAAWARQGLERLGTAEVRRLSERTCALGYRYECGELAAGERAEYRRIWPSLRRRDTAISRAFTLNCEMRPSAIMLALRARRDRRAAR